MFSRVLYKNGSYIPQGRPMLWPQWFDISDTIFEEEYDKLDCYNSDLDPEEVAVDCAKRYVGNYRDYQGVVYYTPWTIKLFRKFSGPVGMPGCMGARGDTGPEGPAGKARSVHDLQCPHCNRFISDEPSQGLLLEAIGDGKFKFDCEKCESSSEWFNLGGTLMPVLAIKR